jgi:hypothetical protein
MKKIVLLFALFALMSQTVDAKAISVDQAKAIAQRQFATGMKLTASNAKMTLSYTAMNLKGQNDYYVFNREGGQGYVIVSGDDMTDPVLAYSDRGSFDMNLAPEPVKIMFKRYQQSLELMRKNPQHVQAPSLTMNPNGVAPMFLNAYGEGPHWHQFAPYNEYFPVYNGEHCYAGCVPIAVAHILKGLQFPAYGNGSNTFHYMLGDQERTATANFNHTYKYSNMRNAYQGYTSGWQDVAQMVYDIAVAFNAKFSTSSTNVGYEHIMKGMIAYFDYNPNIQYVQKASYAENNWREMVYNELDEGRPVLYFGYRTILNSGASGYVGHAFVMDGYDSEGRVRIIWGFQPEEYNSWFSFDLLSPRIYGDTPYEHDEYKEGFNADQYAIIGIRPSQEGENGGVVVKNINYLQDIMPANDVRGSFEVQALSGPWQGSLRWAIAAKNGKNWNIMSQTKTVQIDLQENETATIDISGSYNLYNDSTYYVVVWSPYLSNSYDWNYFLNDLVPFTVGNWVTPPDPQFILGDVNKDGNVTIADISALIDLLLAGNPSVDENPGADMNQDGNITIGDVTLLIDYLLEHPNA